MSEIRINRGPLHFWNFPEHGWRIALFGVGVSIHKVEKGRAYFSERYGYRVPLVQVGRWQVWGLNWRAHRDAAPQEGTRR